MVISANSVIEIASVRQKIAAVEAECHLLLSLSHNSDFRIPVSPARDIEILPRYSHGPKLSLETAGGQARLLHDLANIELQAMELGLRTLHEFPNTPKEFREELVSVVLDESRHLEMCLTGIEALGYDWGFLPAKTHLWNATSTEDSLLDRILIVHCYLEASGLDSGELILEKLKSVGGLGPREIVNVIAREEVGHVRFGLKWFRNFCEEQKLDANTHFSERLNALKAKIPKRTAKISHGPRTQAGFTPSQIEFLKQF